MSNKYVGALDTTPNRIVTYAELDAVSDVADAAQAAAAIKPDWNAAGGADAEILNRPQVINGLDSTSPTDVLSAAQGKALFDQMLGLGTRYPVADIAARDALTGLSVGDMAMVSDRGDGKWADYEALAVDGQGRGTTWRAKLDQDALAGATSATNLSFTRDSNGVTVVSSTGSDTVLPAATASDAGITTAAQFTDLRDRSRAVAIPGDDSTTTFTVNAGLTDVRARPELWDTATREYVDAPITRAAPSSPSWIVGPFQTAPASGAYELHVYRG